MKLPGVVASGVPSAPRISNARAESESRGWQALGNSLTQVGYTLKNIHQARTSQQITHGEMEQRQSFAELEGRFPGDYISGEGTDSSPILSSEAHALAFAEEADAIIAGSAAGIKDDDAKEAFIFASRTKADEVQNRLSDKYAKHLHSQTVKEGQYLIDSSMGQEDFAAARLHNAAMPVPDYIKEAGAAVINKEEERSFLRNGIEALITNRDDESIQNLEDLRADLVEDNSYLESEERLQWVDNIDRRIAGVKKDFANMSDAWIKKTGFDGSSYAQQLSKGLKIDLTDYNKTMQDIELQMANGKENNQKVLRDMRTAYKSYQHVQAAILVPPVQGESMVAQLKANARTAEQIELADSVRAGYDNFLSGIANAPMDTLIEYGLENPTPLLIPDGNLDTNLEGWNEFLGALGQRDEIFQRNKVSYPTMDKLLTSQERAQFAQYTSSQIPREQLSLIQSMDAQLGIEGSQILWSDIFDRRWPSNYAVVGEMLNETLATRDTGSIEETAIRILRGAQMLSAPDSMHSELIGNIQGLQGDVVAKHLGQIFPGDIARQKSYSNAVWSLYALNSSENSQFRRWSTSNMKDVYDEVFGYHGTINGKMTLSPAPDLPMTVFSDWVDNIPTSVIMAAQPLKASYNLTTQDRAVEIRDGLSDGTLILLNSGTSRNRYVVANKQGIPEASAVRGMPLTITVDLTNIHDQIAEGEAERYVRPTLPKSIF